jgi:hypothetical protein
MPLVSVTADDRRAPYESTGSRARAGLRVLGNHKGLVTLVTVAVVFAVAAGLAVRWWTHPTLLKEGGGLDVATTKPLPVDGSQQSYGVVLPPGRATPTTITFRSTPVATFATNSAQATVTFAICHRPPGARGYFIAGMPGNGASDCTRVEPIVAGTTFQYPTTAEYIIATSTPSRAGRVVMTGADLDYALDRAHWFRRGVEHVDFRIVQRVS